MCPKAAESAAKRTLRIVSKCTSREEFAAVFGRLCDGKSIFIATGRPKPAGTDIRFNITLADNKSMLAGKGRVVDAYQDADNRWRRAGMRIEFTLLDESSHETLKLLVEGREKKAQAGTGPDAKAAVTAQPQREPSAPIPIKAPITNKTLPLMSAPKFVVPKSIPPLKPLAKAESPKPGAPAKPGPEPATPEPVPARPDPALAKTMLPGVVPAPEAKSQPSDGDLELPGIEGQDKRVKGSDYILPANPFGELAAESLEAFVECTLYEETGPVDISMLSEQEGAPPFWGGQSEAAEDDEDEVPTELPPSKPPTSVLLPSSAPPHASALGTEPTEMASVPRREPSEIPPLGASSPGAWDDDEEQTEVTPVPEVLGAGRAMPPVDQLPRRRPPPEARTPPPMPMDQQAALLAQVSTATQRAPDAFPGQVQARGPLPGAPPLAPPPPEPDASMPGPPYPVSPFGQPNNAVPLPTGRPNTETELVGRYSRRSRKATIITVALAFAGTLVAAFLIWGRGSSEDDKVAGTAPTLQADAGTLASDDKTTPPPALADAAAAVLADAAAPAAADEDAATEAAIDAGIALDAAGTEHDDGEGDDDGGEDDTTPTSTAVVDATGGDTCTVELKSSPEGVAVYLGRKKIGVTPGQVELPCGKSTLWFKRKRYEPSKVVITAVAGETATASTRLVRPMFTVKVASRPAKATVYVNGRKVGTTPTSAKVRAYQKATIKLVKNGYKPWSRTVTADKSSMDVRVNLDRKR